MDDLIQTETLSGGCCGPTSCLPRNHVIDVRNAGAFFVRCTITCCVNGAPLRNVISNISPNNTCTFELPFNAQNIMLSVECCVPCGPCRRFINCGGCRQVPCGRFIPITTFPVRPLPYQAFVCTGNICCPCVRPVRPL